MSDAILKGMTWSHPRGYDPMVACADRWQKQTGVEIVWEKRSLQDFESFPVDELARNYDLIVIDHPHVGQITAEGCLVALDDRAYAERTRDLAHYSVGPSFDSYRWQGRQWALPIDAAAQVQAYRPNCMDAPIDRWCDVYALARERRVALPLRPPHNLMALYTLAANLGGGRTSGGPLLDQEIGVRAFTELTQLVAEVDPVCFEQDPIAICETMAAKDSHIVCAPLIYGYISYALDGFRAHPLVFADIPALGSDGPIGSALGGTGIAVSAYAREREAAMDFAYWVASGDLQRGLYAQAGGQPAHDLAWRDRAVNDATAGFYINTRATLNNAWVRPRHNGYMAFQQQASNRINKALQQQESPERVISDLNALFEKSFQSDIESK